MSRSVAKIPILRKSCREVNKEEKKKKLEIWGRAQREADRGVRKQALINF